MFGINKNMIINRDVKMLEEAYISASQKTVNVPPRVPFRQVGDEHEAETLEDRMQGVNVDKKDDDEEYPDIDDIGIDTEATDTDTTHDFNDAVSSAVIGISLGSSKESKECEDVKMTKTDLYSIFTTAKKLHDYVENGQELDTWMIRKITICSDGLSNILKVAEYDNDRNSCADCLQ